MNLYIRERWRQATSPEVFSNATFLAGSTFFASFFRVPFFYVANNLLFNLAQKRFKDEPEIDKDDPDYETKTLVKDEVARESAKRRLPPLYNLLASSLQTFVFPITIFAGGVIKEFFTADIGVDERAQEQGNNAIRFLQAASSTALQQLAQGEGAGNTDSMLSHSVNTERYVSTESFLQKTLDRRFDTVATIKTLATIEAVVREAVTRAGADNATRKAMGDDILISKELEKMAEALNHVSRYKEIGPNGELVHSRSNNAGGMDAQELGLYARDMLQVVSKYIDLGNAAAIVDAEARYAPSMPGLPAASASPAPQPAAAMPQPTADAGVDVAADEQQRNINKQLH